MSRAQRRTWIKLDCYGRLHGSMVYQLEEAEQSVWDKLLCYAGILGHEGQIADNDGRPFPHSFIAYEIHTTAELLESTIEKCQEEGRISEDGTGIHITKWAEYQSEYSRQKPYRDLKAHPIENIELSDIEKDIAGVLSNLDGWEPDSTDPAWLRGFMGEYPELTLDDLKSCLDYYSGREPPPHKGIWKNRLRNWMVKKREFEEELEVGKDEPADPRLFRYGGRQALITRIYRAKLAKGGKWSIGNTRGKPVEYLLDLAKELGL